MKRKFFSKTKIWTAVSLVAIIFIAAVVSVVHVFAANRQSVSSDLKIGYNAVGVATKTKAKYSLIPQSSSSSVVTTTLTTSGGEEELIFNLSDDQTTEYLSPSEDITLDEDYQTAVFEYYFENLSDNAFSLELSSSPTMTNMTAKYYVSLSQLSSENYVSKITNTTLSPQAVTTFGSNLYVYILISVDDEDQDATCSGGFEWVMTARDTINVTLNDGSTTSTLKIIPASEVLNIAMPLVTPPASYDNFGGYFTAQNGGGTKYINSDGTSAHAADLSANTVLYAGQESTVVLSGTVVTGLSDYGRSSGTAIIPEDATEIQAEAFKDETSLTSVEFSSRGGCKLIAAQET